MDDGPSPSKGDAGDDSALRSGVSTFTSCEGHIDSIACDLEARQFCVLQQTRQILVGTSGDVAQVRSRGSVRQITHTGLGTEQLLASAVRLLHIRRDHVLLWAERENAMTGIYRLDRRGLHGFSRLSEIHPAVRSFGKHMLVSGLRQGDPCDHIRYVTDLEDFSLSRRKGDVVSMTPEGEVIVLAHQEIGGTFRWNHQSWRNGRIIASREVEDSKGLTVMPWRDGYCYTQDKGGAFRIWASHDPSIDREFREKDGLPSPAMCWGSPDGQTIVHLVRYDGLPESRPKLAEEYGPRYELFVNAQELPDKEGFHKLDGYVWQPKEPISDDHFRLEWSPLGRAWALRVYIRRMTNDGVHFITERLITSAGRVLDVPDVCNLHEWTVDEDGHAVAYVLSDGHRRRLYVHGVQVAEYPLIWGLTLEDDSVSAHVLSGRSISRRRFQL